MDAAYHVRTVVLCFASLLLGPATAMAVDPSVVDAQLLKQEPYKHTGLVIASVPDVIEVSGSGALVHPRVIVTAAHVVWDDYDKSWFESIEFYHQQHGSELSPKPVRAVAARLHTSYGYALEQWAEEDPDLVYNRDFAAAFFVDDVSDTYGAVEIRNQDYASLLDMPERRKLLLGYPQRDHPTQFNNWLHSHEGDIEFVDWLTAISLEGARYDVGYSPHALFTGFGWQTHEGASGGPLYIQDPDDEGRWVQTGVLIAGSIDGSDDPFVDVRIIDSEALEIINSAILASGLLPVSHLPGLSARGGQVAPYSVGLSWDTRTASADATWEIARRDATGWKLLGVSTSGAFTDTTAQQGIFNSYRVRAVDGLNRSPWSGPKDYTGEHEFMLPTPYGAALGSPEVFWTSGGKAPFFIEDGSVRSGKIGNHENSWIATGIEGPVVLHVRWQAASEEPGEEGALYDYLAAYIDDDQVAAIAGESGIQDLQIPITDGHHELRFEYRKDIAWHHPQDLGRILQARVEYPPTYRTIPGSEPGWGGWRFSHWFGHFYQDPSGWLYNANFGWSYVSNGGSADPFLYLSASSLGWIWTGPSSYPWLYSFDRQGWFAHSPGENWIYGPNGWEEL